MVPIKTDDFGDFWADGSWGFRQIKREAEIREQNRKKTWQEEKEEADKRYQAMSAALWKKEIEGLEAVFGKGNQHGGPCCNSCLEEKEYGYGVDGCCCNQGKHPLENKDYYPEYPPYDGKVPEVFYKWGRSTQERYVKRFNDYLDHEITFLEDGTIVSTPKESGRKYIFKKWEK